MGSKTKTYNVNMLMIREPDSDGNVVPSVRKNGATLAVAGGMHQDVASKMGEVPDSEGYRREGF